MLENSNNSKVYDEHHISEQNLRQKEKTQIKTQSGTCKLCKNSISSDSTVFCSKHLIENRERSRKNRERRQKLGICRACSNPLSEDSKTWCEAHRVEQNARSLLYSRQKRKTVLCKDCSTNPVLPRKQRCEECQDIENQRQLTICKRVDCSQDRVTKYFCREHADEENTKLRERRETLKNNNKCIFCFQVMKESNPHTLCHKCRAKQRIQRTSK